MTLGKIIHLAFEGKNWEEELEKEFFTPDYKRAIDKILSFPLPKYTEREIWLGEYGKEYEETGCRLSAKADGRDKKNHILYEVKTGKGLWTQERADETGQLTLYSFLHWKEFGVIPDCVLISCGVQNGRVKILETKRTEKQILNLCDDIKKVVAELKNKGWWEGRVSSFN